MEFCLAVLVFIVIHLTTLCWCEVWNEIECDMDEQRAVPEGHVPSMRRFPWMGIVQHGFYMAGKERFAITPGILIHVGYVLAPAEDIAKIPMEDLRNTTKFIYWTSDDSRVAKDLFDYILHPEYPDITLASVALLRLAGFAFGVLKESLVPPVCMPLKGGGTFDDLFMIQMNDETGDMGKEAHAMYYVPEKECTEFYVKSELNYTKMAPVYPLCAVSRTMTQSCVWEAGSALVVRQNYAFWTLIGFGVRGIGCGAPSRFISIHRYMEWIDTVIAMQQEVTEKRPDETAFFLRQLHKSSLVLMNVMGDNPSSLGICERHLRGNVLYKERQVVTTTARGAYGFFFLTVHQMAQYKCVIVSCKSERYSDAAIWLEHNCIRETQAQAIGMVGVERKKFECFVYFKTAAFVEFRYKFSFKAELDITMYGTESPLLELPNPWPRTETTDPWWPTAKVVKWGNFEPYGRHKWEQ